MLRKTTDGRLKRDFIELTLKIAASSLHFTKIIDLEMYVHRKSVALIRSVPSLDGYFPVSLAPTIIRYKVLQIPRTMR